MKGKEKGKEKETPQESSDEEQSAEHSSARQNKKLKRRSLSNRLSEKWLRFAGKQQMTGDRPTHLYIWGSSAYGKLGIAVEGEGENAVLSIPNQTVPRRVDGIGPVIGAALGEAHSLALDKNGNIWSWGLDEKGQMAINDPEEDNFTAIPVQRNVPAAIKKIDKIASRYLTTAVLTGDGKVYVCGWNAHGQLGFGDSSDKKELTHLLSIKKKATDVSCGHFHTAVLTDNGQVWTFGRGNRGQLGHGGEENEIKPKKIPSNVFNAKISVVSCGYGHTAAITSQGTLYTWGWAKYGQLGIAKSQLRGRVFVSSPTLVDSFSRRNTGENSASTSSEPVVAVACGQFHTAAITAAMGTVYCWGRGNCGQLGLGHTEDQSTPRPVEALYGSWATSVQCGAMFTLCLTSKDELATRVWAWGSNEHGELGLGDTEDRLLPALVPGLKKLKVQAIICGDDCAAAIASV